MKRKILFVAIQGSIHTVRWLQHLSREEWDVHLFCLGAGTPHSELHHVTLHKKKLASFLSGIQKLCKRISSVLYCLSHCSTTPPDNVSVLPLSPAWRIKNWLDAYALRQVIRTLQPDIVHSLELQRAGYLVSTVKSKWQGAFPMWIASNWGSDIYYFARDLTHQAKIRILLSQLDYYTCETTRDVELARLMGLKAPHWPVFPNAGGFDLTHAAAISNPLPPSKRKLILIKGYQHAVGRALTALEALIPLRDLLQSYTVLVYSPCPSVVKRTAELMKHGIAIFPLPPQSHEAMLALHGQARVSLAVSLSDGISTSMLEAMVMGSFPLQTFTAATKEWIEEGKNGFAIPPDETPVITEKLREALTNDTLVDQAAEYNRTVIAPRIDATLIGDRINTLYQQSLDKVTHFQP